MNTDMTRKDLLERIEEGGIIDFVGPPRSGKTALIIEIASDAKKKGYHVALINARNYHQNIFKKLEILADNAETYSKNLLVVDDCDALLQLNDNALALTQRSIYRLSHGKGRSVILIRTAEKQKTTLKSNLLIPASSYNVATMVSDYRQLLRPSVAVAGFLLRRIPGLIASLTESKNELSLNSNGYESKILFQEEYRKKLTGMFICYIVEREPVSENVPELSLLFQFGLLSKYGEEDYIIAEWLMQIFQESGLLTEKGQPDKKKQRRIAEVVDHCLYDQCVEGFLQYLSHTFDWIKREMELAGFKLGEKDRPLAFFLFRTGQGSLEFLSLLLKQSDLRVILPEAKIGNFPTKQSLIREALRLWFSMDGAS